MNFIKSLWSTPCSVQFSFLSHIWLLPLHGLFAFFIYLFFCMPSLKFIWFLYSLELPWWSIGWDSALPIPVSTGLIPDWGTKIPHDVQCDQNKKSTLYLLLLLYKWYLMKKCRFIKTFLNLKYVFTSMFTSIKF